MKLKSQSGTKYPLVFLSFWIVFWSVGVGALSGGAGRGGAIFFLFLLTHGASELFVFRLIMKNFIDAAKGMFRTPEVSQDLDSMSANWRSRPRMWGLLLWCFLLGVVVLAILLIGTWMPVMGIVDGSASPYLPLLLTCFWGYVAWTWSKALQTILMMIEKIKLSSTFDRLIIKRKGLFLQRDIELPISGLEVTADESSIFLTSGNEDIALSCPPGPEREQLLANLSQCIERAEHDPVSQPEVPKALAEMMGQKT